MCEKGGTGGLDFFLSRPSRRSRSASGLAKLSTCGIFQLSCPVFRTEPFWIL